MIASSDGGGGHLGNSKGNSLTLGGNDNDFLSNFNIGFESKNTWEHELCTVTDGINRGVLDHNSWIRGKKDLERHDHSSKIVLLAVLLKVPLGILDIVHGDHRCVLLEGSTSHSSKLLHVSTTS